MTPFCRALVSCVAQVTSRCVRLRALPSEQGIDDAVGGVGLPDALGIPRHPLGAQEMASVAECSRPMGEHRQMVMHRPLAGLPPVLVEGGFPGPNWQRCPSNRSCVDRGRGRGRCYCPTNSWAPTVCI